MTKYDWDSPKFAEHGGVQTPRRPYGEAALAAVRAGSHQGRPWRIGTTPQPTHRPSGRMCAECVHAMRTCGHLPFHAMRPIGKPDADGTQRVRCTDYTKAT